MSKRSVERRNHDERMRGRPAHLVRSMREEGRDRCACDNCDRTILAAQIKRCGMCGEGFCAHCMKGSRCDACERDGAWMEVFDHEPFERWEEDEIGSNDMNDGRDPGPGPQDDY